MGDVPAVLVYQVTGSQSIPHNTNTTISWEGTKIDQGAAGEGWWNSNAPTILTVPQAFDGAIISFQGSIAFGSQNTTTGRRVASFIVTPLSGQTQHYLGQQMAPSPEGGTVALVSGFCRVAAGDQLKISVLQRSGGEILTAPGLESASLFVPASFLMVRVLGT